MDTNRPSTHTGSPQELPNVVPPTASSRRTFLGYLLTLTPLASLAILFGATKINQLQERDEAEEIADAQRAATERAERIADFERRFRETSESFLRQITNVATTLGCMGTEGYAETMRTYFRHIRELASAYDQEARQLNVHDNTKREVRTLLQRAQRICSWMEEDVQTAEVRIRFLYDRIVGLQRHEA